MKSVFSDCGVPPTILNANVTVEMENNEATTKYMCDSGYIMNGTPSLNRVKKHVSIFTTFPLGVLVLVASRLFPGQYKTILTSAFMLSLHIYLHNKIH
jgi:hypothetical protein